MSCSLHEDRLYLRVAGALDDADRAAIEDHLGRGCPRCLGTLAEIEAIVAHLPLALEPVEPSDRVRERLLARAQADLQASGATTQSHVASATLREPDAEPSAARRPAPPQHRGSTRGGWQQTALAAGLAAIFAGALAALVTAQLGGGADPVQMAEQDTPSDLSSELEDARASIAELETELAEQDADLAEIEDQVVAMEEALGLLRSPRLVAVDLAPTQELAGARGRVFWDWEDYRCYFHATGLPAAGSGRVYAVWLYTDRAEVVRAGVFRSEGVYSDASFYSRLPRDMGDVIRTAVTVEPEDPGDLPSGPVLLEHRTETL